MRKQNIILAVSLLLIIILIAGCTAPPQPSNQTTNVTSPASNHSILCSDKPCFLAAANECNKTNITVTQEIGIMHYETSTDCTFSKTLVKVDDNETADMKDLLEGKNMTCVYQKGQFDPRLVNTLIGGSENCGGELKTDLVKLTVFSG